MTGVASEVDNLDGKLGYSSSLKSGTDVDLDGSGIDENNKIEIDNGAGVDLGLDFGSESEQLLYESPAKDVNSEIAVEDVEEGQVEDVPRVFDQENGSYLEAESQYDYKENVSDLDGGKGINKEEKSVVSEESYYSILNEETAKEATATQKAIEDTVNKGKHETAEVHDISNKEESEMEDNKQKNVATTKEDSDDDVYIYEERKVESPAKVYEQVTESYVSSNGSLPQQPAPSLKFPVIIKKKSQSFLLFKLKDPSRFPKEADLPCLFSKTKFLKDKMESFFPALRNAFIKQGHLFSIARELVLEFVDLGFVLSEDNIYCTEVSLIDIASLFTQLNSNSPENQRHRTLTINIKSKERFSSRFNGLLELIDSHKGFSAIHSRQLTTPEADHTNDDVVVIKDISDEEENGKSNAYLIDDDNDDNDDDDDDDDDDDGISVKEQITQKSFGKEKIAPEDGLKLAVVDELNPAEQMVMEEREHEDEEKEWDVLPYVWTEEQNDLSNEHRETKAFEEHEEPEKIDEDNASNSVEQEKDEFKSQLNIEVDNADLPTSTNLGFGILDENAREHDMAEENFAEQLVEDEDEEKEKEKNEDEDKDAADEAKEADFLDDNELETISPAKHRLDEDEEEVVIPEKRPKI